MFFYRNLAILTAIAVAIIWIAQYDSGYLFINYLGWQLETSLTLALITIATLFAIFYITIRTISRTLKLPIYLVQWQQRRHTEHIRRATHKGTIALTEGNWKQAERFLGRYASGSETPLLNYLGAARAAQKLGSASRRDRYLAAATKNMPDAELAVGLTQVEGQLSNLQTEEALATLRHLHSIAPKHEHVLYLLSKLYQQLKSWDDLLELLPELRKQKVFEAETMDALEEETYQNRLEATTGGLESLQQCWHTIPESVRQKAHIISLYATKLKGLGAEHETELLLRDALKSGWDPELIHLYGTISGDDLMAQLNQLESWLGEHAQHPELLLALGRVSIRNQLWGKALSFLEASIGIEPRAESYYELAKLLQHLGELERANECFHNGLELSVGDECIHHAYDGTITHNPFAALPNPSDHAEGAASSKASE